MLLEYANGAWPYNDGVNGSVNPSYGSSRLHLLQMSPVLRIYDRDQPLSLAASLARVASLLQTAAEKSDANAIINCEDEVYLGAALGCSVGIFRSPYVGMRPSGDMDIYMGGPKQPKHCMDEVTRAVRWHRLAPPYSAQIGPLAVDLINLTDSWKFSKGEGWTSPPDGITLPDGTFVQSAPFRVARGLPLPVVRKNGQAPDILDRLNPTVPYVLTSLNPSGAVTIAALGRISPANGYSIPKTDIELRVGAVPPAIGIFGRYQSLKLIFDQSIAGKRILAQDLAGEQAQDITNQVKTDGAQLMLPGELIDRVGLSAATPGDKSDPGLVLTISK